MAPGTNMETVMNIVIHPLSAKPAVEARAKVGAERVRIEVPDPMIGVDMMIGLTSAEAPAPLTGAAAMKVRAINLHGTFVTVEEAAIEMTNGIVQVLLALPVIALASSVIVDLMIAECSRVLPNREPRTDVIDDTMTHLVIGGRTGQPVTAISRPTFLALTHSGLELLIT